LYPLRLQLYLRMSPSYSVPIRLLLWSHHQRMLLAASIARTASVSKASVGRLRSSLPHLPATFGQEMGPNTASSVTCLLFSFAIVSFCHNIKIRQECWGVQSVAIELN